MKIDDTKLLPKLKMSDKPIETDILARFIWSNMLYVRQVLNKKEAYKEQHTRTKDSKGDS